MKSKIAILLSLSLLSVTGIGSNAYAFTDNDIHYQTVVVTAVNEGVEDKNYVRKVDNRTDTITFYNDSVMTSDISTVLATEEEVEAVESGYTLTFYTVIEPMVYVEEAKKIPELNKYNDEFDNVMSFDMSMFKVLSEDPDGKDVVSYSVVDETPTPIGMQMGISAFDPDKKTVDKCIMVIMHNGVLKTLPVIYDEKTATFVFATYEFSKYFLYYTLKDKETVKPGPTSTPAVPTSVPTVVPTLTPTSVPGPVTPTSVPVPVPSQSPVPTEEPVPTTEPTLVPTTVPTRMPVYPDSGNGGNGGKSGKSGKDPFAGDPLLGNKRTSGYDDDDDDDSGRGNYSSGAYPGYTSGMTVSDGSLETWQLFNMVTGMLENRSTGYLMQASAEGTGNGIIKAPASTAGVSVRMPVTTDTGSVAGARTGLEDASDKDKDKDKEDKDKDKEDKDKEEKSPDEKDKKDVVPSGTPGTEKKDDVKKEQVQLTKAPEEVAPAAPDTGEKRAEDMHDPNNPGTSPWVLVVAIVAAVIAAIVAGIVIYNKKNRG